MLKIIAAGLMLIDHIGMVFFPQHIILRIIGRLSMPLFAYCIAQGFYKTASFQKYLSRMTLFAVVSQIPFLIMMYGASPMDFSYMRFNIGFTFLAALTVLYLYQDIRNHRGVSKLINVALIIGISVLATVLRADYGAYAILLVVVFYEFYLLQKNIFMTGIMLIAATLSLFVMGRSGQVQMQLLGVPSFLIILAIKDKPIKKFKYFFYVFYPVHMLILGLIKWVQLQ